jgi:hypothetical protein
MPLAIMVRFKPMLQTEVLSTGSARDRNKFLFLASWYSTSVQYIFGFFALALVLHVHVHSNVGVFPSVDWHWLVTERTDWHSGILGIRHLAAVLLVRPMILAENLMTGIAFEWQKI